MGVYDYKVKGSSKRFVNVILCFSEYNPPSDKPTFLLTQNRDQNY